MAVTRFDGSPDLLALHAANRLRYPYLLQTQGKQGWDILFAFPQSSIKLATFELIQKGFSFLDELDHAWFAERNQVNIQPVISPVELPFHGGWFVYMGYELLHQLEPSVVHKTLQTDFPIALLTRIPAAILCDRGSKQTFIFAEDGQDALIDEMRHDLNVVPRFQAEATVLKTLMEEEDNLFLDGVEKIKRYIKEGDVFQVNLSREWRGELGSGDASNLYAQLCERNPAPFSGIADFGRHQIVSSSPERLVSVRNGLVETRPIAGTYARSIDPEQDAQLCRDLLAHPKERAEHIMMVDLERNDLGRICQPGSVEVDDLMAVKTYAHVHHIESNIRGLLRSDVTPGKVLKALFPGGTITGCPKVRTMQIISELEQSPRLAYTGSMGYLNHDGSMDMNILIRSFMLSQQELRFRAGAGIVADSVPERELNETRAKAKGLLRALSS
ncbi:aminodeoxychorismate synthase component I [Sulfurirhabdus autotrophica]|uniref:Anthranilate synthase component 1 n=1 Tax=Sulfurirhabdus autotrophica TaxID=1706046 RepID=A0A4R3YDH9_9PROT|nr:aminodeoxychorismate synthase component I [Sulfurirhabdus autotrophica]TCV90070.1 anthranilate synthase component 1 [Sulfurirhabdus autotrophica]